MSEIHRRYPVVEVAILTVSNAPLASGHERAVEGDIICVRPPQTGVGAMEMHRHLWLRLSGWEEEECAALTDGASNGIEGAGEVRYEKRRYQILLGRLKAIVPGFDPARARDQGQVYQPFLAVDEESGFFTSQAPPLDATGLVFDVVARRFR